MALSRARRPGAPSPAREICSLVSAGLRRLADPEKAGPMAAYMKTDMPFYGVQKAGRERILREVKKRVIIVARRDYADAVQSLWSLPHREEKYMAIAVARHFGDFVTPPSLGLYEKMILEGAWWDLVDEIAIKLVGKVLYDHRREVAPLMDRWIGDDDPWVRRAALISQIGHKEETDHRRLFRYCLACCHEKLFFIRRAIGWALREYSYTSPERVKTFLVLRKNRLSALSFREGAKALLRQGETFDDE